jgi:hypothetical protein
MPDATTVGDAIGPVVTSVDGTGTAAAGAAGISNRAIGTCHPASATADIGSTLTGFGTAE